MAKEVSKSRLTNDGLIILISNMADNYVKYIDYNNVPKEFTYQIITREEPSTIERSCRKAAFKDIVEPGLKKFAFDTRRVDQEHDRNPRANLQYWHRSDEFITEDQQKKINLFSKLYAVLSNLKTTYGDQQEWHNSYARTLYETVGRTLRVKQGDSDIFGSQLVYLEQLLDARYRLRMDELEKISDMDLKQCILKKDESLSSRGVFLNATQDKGQSKEISKDGNKTTQESIINALFGAGTLRRDGDGSVIRTVTITIKDSVED